MPSLKMKTKPTIGCLREKNGLHVCQKSSIIAKKSLSHLRISRQGAKFEAVGQNCQDVSLCNKVCPEEIGGDEAIDCLGLLDEENLQFEKMKSTSIDSATAGRMDSMPATSTSSIETIFSPGLEGNDIHNVHIDGDAGSIKELAVPQSGTDDSDDNGRSSCEYQSCDISDFYISDMIVSGLPIEDNRAYGDITEATSFPDYKCDEPSLFFDVADDYMMLPLLEETMETNNGLDGRTSDEPTIDSDSSSLYLAIHQLKSCNQESDVDTFLDSDQVECFDPHMFIRSLSDLSNVTSNSQPNILPKDTQKTKPITLVLDLDETLVHSTLEHCDDADFTFPVYFNMKEHTVYVKQRPYLRTFLERVAEMFEIVVFTASQSIYAKQLLDILDPDGMLISRRAYRESCIFSDGCYTKDLTVLGADLAKVAIIDNSPQVFRWQVNNGIPIKSWFDDPLDSALISLLPFLETLVDADDVRPVIAKRFGNKE